MVIITKKNECYLHVDAPQHILYELQDHFSFDVEGASFSPAYRRKQWDGRIRLFSVVGQTIPAGLVYRLCKWLDKYNYEWEFQNNEFYGLPFELNNTIFYEGVELFLNHISNIKPREYQVQSVFQALKEYRKTIVSPTGSGKSLSIYGIVRYLKSIGDRSLIVVPTKALVEQMYKDMEDYGWNADENIHRIYQGKPLDSDKPVVISTWQSIYGLDKKWFRQYNGIVFDECHQAKAKALQGIMKKCLDTKYRIGFTGTLDGKNVNQLILEGSFGPVYKTTTSSDLMKKGILAKLQIQIHLLTHPRRSFDTYNDEIVYLVECEERNKYLCELANSLKGNVLVLFTRVEGHGVPLAEMIINSTDKQVHLIHGGVNVDVREQVREIAEKSDDNIILGSYGTMSTGVNIKNLSHIIFASPSKSQVRVLQSIGRGLRQKLNNKCMLYDIADEIFTPSGRHNFTWNHLSERMKMYIEQDFEYEAHKVTLNTHKK
jgi:superfamily II DNA or RNA helicase